MTTTSCVGSSGSSGSSSTAVTGGSGSSRSGIGVGCSSSSGGISARILPTSGLGEVSWEGLLPLVRPGDQQTSAPAYSPTTHPTPSTGSHAPSYSLATPPPGPPAPSYSRTGTYSPLTDATAAIAYSPLTDAATAATVPPATATAVPGRPMGPADTKSRLVSEARPPPPAPPPPSGAAQPALGRTCSRVVYATAAVAAVAGRPDELPRQPSRPPLCVSTALQPGASALYDSLLQPDATALQPAVAARQPESTVLYAAPTAAAARSAAAAAGVSSRSVAERQDQLRQQRWQQEQQWQQQEQQQQWQQQWREHQQQWQQQQLQEEEEQQQSQAAGSSLGRGGGGGGSGGVAVSQHDAWQRQKDSRPLVSESGEAPEPFVCPISHQVSQVVVHITPGELVGGPYHTR